MELPMDCVIMALGTSPNPLIKSTTEGLETQKWGGIVADADTGLTSRPGVYAGGDAVSGAATVILAMGAGKTAASAIDRQLMVHSFPTRRSSDLKSTRLDWSSDVCSSDRKSVV